MQTIHAFIIVFVILLIGLTLFYLMMCISELIMHKTISTRSIFKDFGQKMWMTIGLGSVFFGIYFIAVSLGSHLLDSESRLNLFFKFYKNPVEYIYIGLLIFAMVSASIYLCRMAIKHLYNTRRKD